MLQQILADMYRQKYGSAIIILHAHFAFSGFIFLTADMYIACFFVWAVLAVGTCECVRV